MELKISLFCDKNKRFFHETLTEEKILEMYKREYEDNFGTYSLTEITIDKIIT